MENLEEDRVTVLEALVNRLNEENTRLRAVANPKRKTEYTFYDLERMLYPKLGRVYGWKAAYIAASQQEGLQPVSLQTFQFWAKKTKGIPAWAIDQVSQMKFSPRPKPVKHQEWTKEENSYLCNLYMENTKTTNAELATFCTEEFGRFISICSIKGKLDRLRKDNAGVTRYRPGHERELVDLLSTKPPQEERYPVDSLSQYGYQKDARGGEVRFSGKKDTVTHKHLRAAASV